MHCWHSLVPFVCWQCMVIIALVLCKFCPLNQMAAPLSLSFLVTDAACYHIHIEMCMHVTIVTGFSDSNLKLVLLVSIWENCSWLSGEVECNQAYRYEGAQGHLPACLLVAQQIYSTHSSFVTNVPWAERHKLIFNLFPLPDPNALLMMPSHHTPFDSLFSQSNSLLRHNDAQLIIIIITIIIIIPRQCLCCCQHGCCQSSPHSFDDRRTAPSDHQTNLLKVGFHYPSSRAELTARELGCIFWHPSTRAVNSGSGNRTPVYTGRVHGRPVTPLYTARELG